MSVCIGTHRNMYVLDAIHAVRVRPGNLRVLLAGTGVIQLDVLLLAGGDQDGPAI